MSHAATWAIVPVKSLEQAKQRLAAVLPLAVRRRLMLVMLEDVLATLRHVERLGPVVAVTPDAEVAELAANAGARVLREASSQGHSAAAIAGFAYAQSRGAVRALTLPADAPLVTAAELRSLIEGDDVTAGPVLTLVPSHDGDGTNGFLVPPPDLIQPSFGPGKLPRHLSQAMAAPRNRSHVRASARILRPATSTSRGISARLLARRWRLALRFPRAPRPGCRWTAAKSPRERSMTSSGIRQALAAAAGTGRRAVSLAEAMALAECDDLRRLAGAGRAPLPRRPRHTRQLLQEGVHPADAAVPRRLPLLHLRARAARGEPAYLSPDAVLEIARAGQAAGCKEALFTLGDQPELRYAAAREALAALGFDSRSTIWSRRPRWC